MSAYSRISLFLLLCVLFAFGVYAEERKILFTEDFKSLENWRPFYFPKKKHTDYSIVQEECKTYLRAESHNSASALVYKKKFNVYEYPRARWRWRVNNVYVRGDDGTKQGDDYPMRIYIAFEYDPGREGFFERIKNTFTKKIYGEYPPHSCLNYVWTGKEHKEKIINSPFTGKVRILVLEQGSANIGKWEDEDVDIVADYRKAFGKAPPAIADIAIMNDSDNTGESSTSFLEYLEIYR